MKKIIYSLFALVVSTGVFAQKAFKKYEDSDNVGTLTISKSMMGIVAQFSAGEESQEAKDFIDLAKNINEIKVYLPKNAVASADIKKTVKQHLKKSSMEELMRVRDDGAQVDFYVKNTNDDNVVSELLMFANGTPNKKGELPETILVTMSGKIELDKIGALVNKMKLPKELKKAGRKAK